MKRVCCLYRVSTMSQVGGNSKDDIPMQRSACHNFIKQNGWLLEKEYIELGVSGYKLSAAERDAIQEIKKDAENGTFDVFLVFMFDRIGRRDDETPFVIQWLVEMGG